MSRQSRAVRRAGVRVELTARDEALLRALARFRIARTSDLVALLFSGVRKDTAAERFRRLFDAGYLDVRAGDRAEENVYAVGPVGRRWLEAHGVRSAKAPRGGVEHHLAIVRTWMQLARAVSAVSGFTLEVVRSDWEIRERLGASAESVVPDLLVQMSAAGSGGRIRRIRLAIEVDLTTERGPALRRKIRAYRRLLESGEGLFSCEEFGLGIVLVGAGASRRGSVLRLFEREWTTGWGGVWDESEWPDELLRALRNGAEAPLSSSPCGEGSSDGVSAVNETDQLLAGAGYSQNETTC